MPPRQRSERVYFSRVGEAADDWKPTPYVTVRKARIGWWVDGAWCPTERIRDHWMKRCARRKGAGETAWPL